METAWGASVPQTPGRDTAGILAAVGIAEPELTDFGVAAEAFDENNAFHGEVDDPEDRAPGLAGLLIGGVEISDLPDPAAALAAVASAGFVVSLEIRTSAVTELADVVFPVAAVAEKSGAFLNWEGRLRPFDAALPEAGMLDEARILDTLGVEMDVDLYTQTPAAAAGEIARLGTWSGARPALPAGGGVDHDAQHATRRQHADAGVPGRMINTGDGASDPAGGERFVLASWRMNLDGSRGLDGEEHISGTARPDVVRLSPTDSARLGLRPGDAVTVRGPASAITLPLNITGMVDGVVWLPARIDGVATAGRLGADVAEFVEVLPAMTQPIGSAGEDI